MPHIIENIRAGWDATEVSVQKGISLPAIQEFEKSRDVLMPADMREYFHCMNGMPGNMWDEHMIRFLPLEEICNVREEFSERQPPFRRVLSQLPEPEEWFIFAEYLCSSHYYAIRLGAGENSLYPVIWLYDSEYHVVAESFTEFLELYISRPQWVLFPMEPGKP